MIANKSKSKGRHLIYLSKPGMFSIIDVGRINWSVLLNRYVFSPSCAAITENDLTYILNLIKEIS